MPEPSLREMSEENGSSKFSVSKRSGLTDNKRQLMVKSHMTNLPRSPMKNGMVQPFD